MVGVGDVQKLTQRQKEVLRLPLNGFDAKSAARELRISGQTVNEQAGRSYEVWFNQPPYMNLKSLSGTRAQPYQLRFLAKAR